MLSGISPSLQQFYDLCTTEAVTFRQLSANAGTYRDAVEFKNGVNVRLQDLEEGQSVEVLALSSEKAGVREEIHFRRRVDWHAGSPDMHDSSFATPEEPGNFYFDGGPEIPSLIPRGFGR